MMADFDQFEDCFQIDFEENQDNQTTENQDNTFSTIDTIDREESSYNSKV
jgi:hypothetical protein